MRIFHKLLVLLALCLCIEPMAVFATNGQGGNIYATKNDRGQWEVLRLYDFKSFDDNIYRRDAVLETNENIKYNLADIPLANGVLRIDRVSVPHPTIIRLGHYTLPKIEGKAFSIEKSG